MGELITISPTRKFGGIIIDCSIQEAHTDRMQITDHPVEQGAAISDHAYLQPSEVTIRAGWSNSSLSAVGSAVSALLSGGLQGLAGDDYVRKTYQSLLDLQATRKPFDIVTGKRTYKNMMFSALAVTTDEKTENALMLVATCRQVIIVQTQTTSVPPADVHTDPAKTAPVQNSGTVQPQPAALSPTGG